MSFIEKICAYYPDTLYLSAFSSIQEVGMGLYLGLAVVQLITSGGISGLYRKVDRLHGAVTANKLNGELGEIRSIKSQLVTLEQRTQSVGQTLFWVVFALILLAAFLLARTALISDSPVSCGMATFMLAYNLLVPLALFSLMSLYFRRMSIGVRQKIKECEKKVIHRLAS